VLLLVLADALIVVVVVVVAVQEDVQRADADLAKPSWTFYIVVK
jgi:hypothetical protein